MSGEPGSPKEFEGFIAVAYPELFVSAMRQCGDRDKSADAVQQTLLRLWKRWVETGDANVWSLPYGRQTLRRVIIDSWRKLGRSPRTAGDKMIESTPCEDTHAEDFSIDDERLQHALGALTKRQREILDLTVVEGLTSGEAAQRLELDRDTVSKYKRVALSKVRDHLQKGQL